MTTEEMIATVYEQLDQFAATAFPVTGVDEHLLGLQIGEHGEILVTAVVRNEYGVNVDVAQGDGASLGEAMWALFQSLTPALAAEVAAEDEEGEHGGEDDED